MRKRCRRTPRAVHMNPVKYVMDGFVKIGSMGDYNRTLRLKNHSALTSITSGTGTKTDVDLLITATNMAVALKDVCDLGKDYEPALDAMHDAVFALASRGIKTGKFIFTGPELQAVNYGMEIHDAQLDACTVQDIEKASRYIQKRIHGGKARVIAALPNQPQ